MFDKSLNGVYVKRGIKRGLALASRRSWVSTQVRRSILVVILGLSGLTLGLARAEGRLVPSAALALPSTLSATGLCFSGMKELSWKQLS